MPYQLSPQNRKSLFYPTGGRRNAVESLPYLQRTARSGIKFYEQCLGGKIVMMMTHEGTPAAEQVPAEWRAKILHARLNVGDEVLMGSDAPPDHYREPQGFSVSLSLDEPAEAERIFQAFAENGKVQMPLEKTFWAVRFGMVVDRFGIPRMIACE